MNEEWKGDFLGFTFAGKHSDVFNIVRTSDGDRFEEALQPEINDITVEIPGRDGNYYFGSTFGNQTFSISFAFDHLTEEQFRYMRRWLGCKSIGELIFDEHPYKKYLAKIESPIELSYVCFDQPKKQIVGTTIGDERYGVRKDSNTGERERVYPYELIGGTERIYKGEGTIEFICYFPFAKSVFKYLDNMDSDWASSSGMLTTTEKNEGNYDIYIQNDQSSGNIITYNPGDIATGFRLLCVGNIFNDNASDPYNDETVGIQLYYTKQSLTENLSVYDDGLKIKKFDLKTGDIGFIIDTEAELIYGIQSVGTSVEGNRTYIRSSNIYNEYIYAGHFFKIDPHELKTDKGRLYIYGINNAILSNNSINNTNFIELHYNYLYF